MSRKSFTYYYTVVTVTYRTQEMKERRQPGEHRYAGKTHYQGFDLATAQRTFWRVCREAMTNPLAAYIVVRRNDDVFMKLAPSEL